MPPARKKKPQPVALAAFLRPAEQSAAAAPPSIDDLVAEDRRKNEQGVADRMAAFKRQSDALLNQSRVCATEALTTSAAYLLARAGVKADRVVYHVRRPSVVVTDDSQPGAPTDHCYIPMDVIRSILDIDTLLMMSKGLRAEALLYVTSTADKICVDHMDRMDRMDAAVRSGCASVVRAVFERSSVGRPFCDQAPHRVYALLKLASQQTVRVFSETRKAMTAAKHASEVNTFMRRYCVAYGQRDVVAAFVDARKFDESDPCYGYAIGSAAADGNAENLRTLLRMHTVPSTNITSAICDYLGAACSPQTPWNTFQWSTHVDEATRVCIVRILDAHLRFLVARPELLVTVRGYFRYGCW